MMLVSNNLFKLSGGLGHYHRFILRMLKRYRREVGFMSETGKEPWITFTHLPVSSSFREYRGVCRGSWTAAALCFPFSKLRNRLPSIVLQTVIYLWSWRRRNHHRHQCFQSTWWKQF
ncbi:hypothetical protein LINGRAHAP2_LOCUS23576 [Linum grandiflorum]